MPSRMWAIVLPMFAPALFILGGEGKTADTKWIDVKGVRIVEPPAEHPRLYLRARDLPDLKRRLGHPVLKPVWEELQALAKNNAQARLEVDALRYLLDRDADLGRRTVAEALRQLEQLKLSDDKTTNSRKVGRMMVTAAIVYDWCYPVLTEGAEGGVRHRNWCAWRSTSNAAIRRTRGALSPAIRPSG